MESNEALDTSPKKKYYDYDFPFGGLFGNTVIANVVEEIIADPYSAYTAEGLKDLTNRSLPRIRKALVYLQEIGLLKNIKPHEYIVNRKSKKFSALIFLAYAISDDHDNTDLMDSKILKYCSTFLKDRVKPQMYVIATNERYRDISESTKYAISANSPMAVVA